jgi:SH3 domain protein
MKWYMIVGIILVMVYAPVQAESLYIGEIIEITLRTGPGIDHKVIGMIKSGELVEILEPGTEWTHVRLASEKEGYVLSRFLTTKKPNEMLLRELQDKYQALGNKSDRLSEENKKKQEENKSLQSELQQKGQLLERVTESYEKLRKESTEFLNLRSNYKKMSSNLNEQSQRAEQLEKDLTKIQKQVIFRWVLIGAAILLAGFLVGMSSKRQRRRSTLL